MSYLFKEYNRFVVCQGWTETGLGGVAGGLVGRTRDKGSDDIRKRDKKGGKEGNAAGQRMAALWPEAGTPLSGVPDLLPPTRENLMFVCV